MTDPSIGASFRDPSGYIFEHDGLIHRQVNRRYAEDYELLMSSGLYEALVQKQLLLPHEEVPPPSTPSAAHLKTLLPEQVPFISYPYEWCFSELKDAAIATLRVQSIALHHGMTLKDASAYNIQFHRGRPIMIDTLSFERYQDGAPWVAYRQFCQHFLAPLALMSYRDVRLNGLLRVHIDGVPLDLAASLLPARAWLRPGLFLHIRAHARYQNRYQDVGAVDPEGDPVSKAPRRRKISKQSLTHMIRALLGSVEKLDWSPTGTEWAEYESGESYREDSLEHKRQLVHGYLESVAAESVWDLGANTGVYSRIAAQRGAEVLSFDVDPACVERNYLEVKANAERSILPLLLDLVNPSPALGWAHQERDSLLDRSGPDLVLALALIHHIAISNNVPLSRIASYLSKLAEHLVIEFVPKSDPKVMTLLATREDVFPDYTREGFVAAFSELYRIRESAEIKGSDRILYWMTRLSQTGSLEDVR
jgi:hypothetical protein